MAINRELLEEELTTAGVPFDGVSEANGGRIDYNPNATQNQRDTGAAVLLAHNPAGVSQAQLLRATRLIALQTAKVYLLTQLLTVSPDVPTIYTTVKATVDGNVLLARGVANQLAVLPAPAAWTGTNTVERRYLFAVEMFIALIG